MDKLPLVSVLMTSYNREKYIAEAIESVLASTYTNFELIIVDDCSADATVAIAQKYAAHDKRVKLHVNTENLGDYTNRNRAASFSTGKYLKYLDSDDTIYPYSLSIMIAHMEKYPEAAYAFTASCFHSSDKEMRFPKLVLPADSFRNHFLYGGFFYAGPGGTIINKKIFDSFNGFSDRRFISDQEFFMRVALKHPVLLIQPALIWWRVHENQEAVFESRQVAVIADRYKMNIEFLLQSPLNEIERKKVRVSIDKMMARHLLKQLVIKFNWTLFKQMKKTSGLGWADLLKAFNIKNKINKFFGN